MGRRLLVVGGDAAGMSAAALARRRDEDLEVVVVERTRWTSASACGLADLAAGRLRVADDLVARTPDEFRAARIDVRTEHEVTGLDLEARRASVSNLAHGRTFTLGFDLLHIATGARPHSPGVAGEDLDHVHAVRTVGDGARLLDDYRRRRPGAVAVIGGDYTGLQMAEALRDRGAAVEVLVPAPEVLEGIDADLASAVSSAGRNAGVAVETGVVVDAIEPGAVVVNGGRRVPADLVLLALGTAPDTALASEAGLATGTTGGLVVSRRQEASQPGVWAAGDCCEAVDMVGGLRRLAPLGSVANRQGRVAAINATGGYAAFPGVLATFATTVFGIEVGRTGLDAEQAAAAGFEAEEVTVDSASAEPWVAGRAPVRLRMLAERHTGRLLGAQTVGGPGASRRMDVIAAALSGRLTVDDLAVLDLAHDPRLGPVADPVQVAARMLLPAL